MYLLKFLLVLFKKYKKYFFTFLLIINSYLILVIMYDTSSLEKLYINYDPVFFNFISNLSFPIFILEFFHLPISDISKFLFCYLIISNLVLISIGFINEYLFIGFITIILRYGYKFHFNFISNNPIIYKSFFFTINNTIISIEEKKEIYYELYFKIFHNNDYLISFDIIEPFIKNIQNRDEVNLIIYELLMKFHNMFTRLEPVTLINENSSITIPLDLLSVLSSYASYDNILNGFALVGISYLIWKYIIKPIIGPSKDSNNDPSDFKNDPGYIFNDDSSDKEDDYSYDKEGDNYITYQYDSDSDSDTIAHFLDDLSPEYFAAYCKVKHLCEVYQESERLKTDFRQVLRDINIMFKHDDSITNEQKIQLSYDALNFCQKWNKNK